MRIEIERLARGIQPGDAARWWADFREGREDHRFLPGTRRRVTPTGPGAFRLQEETRLGPLRVWRETVDAVTAFDEVRFHGRNDLATFDGRYRFEPAEGGTRVRLLADVHLVRPLGWTGVVAKPVVEQILRVDLAAHVKDMQRDLKRV